MDIQYIYQINNLLNPDLTKKTIGENGEIVEEEKEKKEKKKSQREIFFLKKKSKNTKK